MESIKKWMLVDLTKIIPWWSSTSGGVQLQQRAQPGSSGGGWPWESRDSSKMHTSRLIATMWWLWIVIWMQEGSALPIPLCDISWIPSLFWVWLNEPSMSHSLNLRKASEVRWICIVGWCGLRRRCKTKLLLSACTPSLTSFIWRCLSVWFRMTRGALKSTLEKRK